MDISLLKALPFLKELWMVIAGRKSKSTYLIIQVLCLLDEYVEACASVVSDNGSVEGRASNYQFGYYEPTVKTPILNFSSLDVEWESLPPNLMYEILSFPSKVGEANRIIEGAWDNDDPPYFHNFYEERQSQYVELGIGVADLSARLRKKYKFPKKQYNRYDPVECLKEKKKEIFDEKTQRQLRYVAPLSDI